MLVLSRKTGEAIVFPGLDVTITVSNVKGRATTLGIEAPRDVKIILDKPERETDETTLAPKSHPSIFRFGTID